jgi:thioredoxin-like negative regulator of GroEL
MRIFAVCLSLLLQTSLIKGDGIKEPKGSKVSVLNKDLFPRFISRSPLVLMEWYAPWCGHCQELAPVFREAADRLAAMKKAGEIPQAVKFAKMNDGDEYNHAGRFGAEDMYNFSSYPALFIFKDGDLKNPEPYYGGREVDDIVFWMAAVAKGLDPIEEEMKARPGLYKGHTTDVLELSPETFNATVKMPSNLNNNVLYIVEFYSDRCPYCKILSPEIVTASQTLQSEEPRAIMSACNTRIYHDVAEQNGITGYPWVAAFYNGKKVEDMAGLGGADSVVRFAKRMIEEHYDESLGAAPVRQEVTYDNDGIMILDDERKAWAEADKAKWAEIEAQKEAGTYVEPEPEPQVEKKAPKTNHEEEERQRIEAERQEEEARARAQQEDRQQRREKDAKQAASPPSSGGSKYGHVLNAGNSPPPPGAKLGPGVDPELIKKSGLDAVSYIEKKIKDHEEQIDQYKVEALVEAKKNVYGHHSSHHENEAVEVTSSGVPISQADIDKGAAWRASLGRQTWFFLHTLAAKYPEYPSEIDQRAVRNLIGSLGQLYPCKLCRNHLRLKLMQDSLGPVRTENRTALATWLCELHNMVNVDTGKEHYHDCSPFNLDLQYLKDCGECEGPGAAPKKKVYESTDVNRDAERAVFDARHYAKDGVQYHSEMVEAMEALSNRMLELDTENILLKKAWPSDVPRPV